MALEILEVGKNFFAASSVKKMSRFEEVSPEEIKRIVDNATPINTKRSTKYGLKIFNTYSPVQTAQRSSHVVDRSSHDRSTISATATSKFTTTTASPAEQLIVKEKCLHSLFTGFHSLSWRFFEETASYFLNTILSSQIHFLVGF